jgi:transposase
VEFEALRLPHHQNRCKVCSRVGSEPARTIPHRTYLAAQYARIKGRHGHNKAIVAVAHSILVIAYHILQRGQPYNELGGDYFIERQNKDAYQRRLVKQLERMGYEVALTKHAA